MKQDSISGLPDGFDEQVYELWFKAYTLKFLPGSEFDAANVQLKIDHSYQVLELAQRIAAALPLAPWLQALAHIAALLHDVGRFPQYARYRTFQDAVSVNHAYQGVLTLKDHKVLDKLPPAPRNLVLAAVALHNRHFLPTGLSPELRHLTQIVRDADKLDIFSVMLAHFNPAAPPNKVVNLGLKPHPNHYTPDVLAKVLQRQMVNYHDMVWVNDFKLLLCSWIYDLNYHESFRIVRERGYLDTLMQYLPDNPDFFSLGQQLRRDLATAEKSGPPIGVA